MYRQMYSFIFNLASPLTLGRLFYRKLKAPAYGERVSERFAFGSNFDRLSKAKMGRPIWLHAVSVGEVMAATQLVDHCLKAYPDQSVMVTTSTPTGSERVKSRWGDRVLHLYLPYDFDWAIKRFVHSFNPSLLVIIETELWPNLVHYVAKSGCPILLANARLSSRSAKGYGRFKPFVKQMLQQIDRVAVQAVADGERFKALGLPPERLQVTGSIKFDIEVDDELVKQGKRLRERLGRKVLIAASTHAGEDELILGVFADLKQEYPELLLVLVPRHPERFDTVSGIAERAGWRVGRRSNSSLPGSSDDVFIGDTMGEMLFFYSFCHVAFVGGSLVPTGGHNVLEPVAIDIPVLVGPHMFNFQYVTDSLEEVGGIVRVSTVEELTAKASRLLKDQESVDHQVMQASKFLRENQGSLEKQIAIIDELLRGNLVDGE